MKLTDEQRIDWLQHQGVRVIYLDDGWTIGVRGGSVRDALDEHIRKSERAAMTSAEREP